MKKKRAIFPSLIVIFIALFTCLHLVSCKSQTKTEKPEKYVIGKVGVATVAKESLEDIIKRSDACAIGKVVRISPSRLSTENNKYFEDAIAYREVTIEVEKYLFNKTGLSNEITLKVIGGEVKLPPEAAAKTGYPEGTEVIRVYEDEARFKPGEKVLVFIGKGKISYKKADGTETTLDRLALVGAWQGKFRIEEDEAINEMPDRSEKVSEIRNLINQVMEKNGKQE